MKKQKISISIVVFLFLMFVIPMNIYASDSDHYNDYSYRYPEDKEFLEINDMNDVMNNYGAQLQPDDFIPDPEDAKYFSHHSGYSEKYLTVGFGDNVEGLGGTWTNCEIPGQKKIDIHIEVQSVTTWDKMQNPDEANISFSTKDLSIGTNGYVNVKFKVDIYESGTKIPYPLDLVFLGSEIDKGESLISYPVQKNKMMLGLDNDKTELNTTDDYSQGVVMQGTEDVDTDNLLGDEVLNIYQDQSEFEFGWGMDYEYAEYNPNAHFDITQGRHLKLNFVVAKNSTGTISLQKQGEDGQNLKGARFEVDDWNGNKVSEMETDENGYAKSTALPEGDYTVYETVAPDNYLLNDQKFNAAVVQGKDIQINDGQPVIDPLPNIAIEKAIIGESGDESNVVENEEDLIYELTVTNTDEIDAYNINIRDSLLEQLPEYITYDNSTLVVSSDSTQYSGDLENGDFTLQTVSANSSVTIDYVLHFNTIPDNEGEVINVVTDDGSTPPKTCPEDNDTNDDVDCQDIPVKKIDPPKIAKEVDEPTEMPKTSLHFYFHFKYLM